MLGDTVAHITVDSELLDGSQPPVNKGKELWFAPHLSMSKVMLRLSSLTRKYSELSLGRGGLGMGTALS